MLKAENEMGKPDVGLGKVQRKKYELLQYYEYFVVQWQPTIREDLSGITLTLLDSISIDWGNLPSHT